MSDIVHVSVALNLAQLKVKNAQRHTLYFNSVKAGFWVSLAFKQYWQRPNCTLGQAHESPFYLCPSSLARERRPGHLIRQPHAVVVPPYKRATSPLCWPDRLQPPVGQHLQTRPKAETLSKKSLIITNHI